MSARAGPPTGLAGPDQRQRRLRRPLRRRLERRLDGFLRHRRAAGQRRHRQLSRHLRALRGDHQAGLGRRLAPMRGVATSATTTRLQGPDLDCGQSRRYGRSCGLALKRPGDALRPQSDRQDHSAPAPPRMAAAPRRASTGRPKRWPRAEPALSPAGNRELQCQRRLVYSGSFGPASSSGAPSLPRWREGQSRDSRTPGEVPLQAPLSRSSGDADPAQ